MRGSLDLRLEFANMPRIYFVGKYGFYFVFYFDFDGGFVVLQSSIQEASGCVDLSSFVRSLH